MSSAGASGPPTETVYIGGQTYIYNSGAAVKLDPSSALLRQAGPLYLMTFPVAPGTSGPITLAAGYQPQHNGDPSPYPYHDHVLTSLPGRGTSATAGEYSAPLRVVVMRYSWAYTYSSAFVPITDVARFAAAEAAGELELINPGAADPYQTWTTDVLVRPIIWKSA